MANAELSEADQKLMDDIKRYGLHIVHVPGEDDLPPFSYSVGLYETYDHPEVIIVGLPRESAHIIINNLAEDIGGGKSFTALSWSKDVIENFKCLFIKVDKANYRDYVGYNLWYYDDDDFPLLQCLYPTVDGAYPWESTWPDDMKYLQPILGTTTKF